MQCFRKWIDIISFIANLSKTQLKFIAQCWKEFNTFLVISGT